MYYTKSIYILLTFLGISFSQPTDVFEVQSIIHPGRAYTKRFMSYQINIYKKNNEWVIKVIDGPLQSNNTIFKGIVPKEKIYSLYDSIKDPTQHRYEEFDLEMPRCELTVVLHKQNNLTLNHDFSDFEGVNIHKKSQMFTSTISGFRPGHDEPKRKIEEIHKLLFSFAKNYALIREQCNLDESYITLHTGNCLPPLIGKIDLKKQINFYDVGFEISDFISLKNKHSILTESDRGKSQQILFEITKSVSLLISDHQLYKVSHNYKESLSPKFLFFDDFVLSENAKYLLFGQYIHPIKNLYYRLDLDTKEIIQILALPTAVTEMKVDNTGDVFLEVNGEIFKWYLNN